MQTDQLVRWLTYFYIYCFLGWVWESCYVSVLEKKLVNRGFMKGPLLPIYGSGAVCILLVTHSIRDNYLLMALIGMAAATVLEYVTGAVMESMFKVRYWDYSTEFLNLNGYVCLKSTICWGAMTFLVTYGIHPPVAQLVARIPQGIMLRVDFVITALAGADFATSFKAAMDFRDLLVKAERMRRELRGIQARLDELEKQVTDKTKDVIVSGTVKMRDAIVSRTVKAKDQLLEEWQDLNVSKLLHIEGLRNTYSRSIGGLLKRNPNAVSRRYAESLEEIKKTIRERWTNREGE